MTDRPRFPWEKDDAAAPDAPKPWERASEGNGDAPHESETAPTDETIHLDEPAPDPFATQEISVHREPGDPYATEEITLERRQEAEHTAPDEIIDLDRASDPHATEEITAFGSGAHPEEPVDQPHEPTPAWGEPLQPFPGEAAAPNEPTPPGASSDEDLSVDAVSFRGGAQHEQGAQRERAPHDRERDNEDIHDHHAGREPIGDVTMASLSKRRARTLAAFADALIPPGGSALPSALAVGVPSRVDEALRASDDDARARIAQMLRVLEWAPVGSRALRPLSRLSAGAAEAAVERALTSKNPALRAAAETIKELVVSRWASDPAVERGLGYDYGCTTNAPKRSREALEILTIDRDHVEECDVVVVGSGAGGAVAARELAELGLSVVVLEEGLPHGRAGVARAPALRRDSLYRANGLARATGKPGARLVLGRGVGGSTLGSYGTIMRAPDGVLDAWGASGLDGLDAAGLRPYYERVERQLFVAPMPEELAGSAALTLAAGVRARGVSAVLPRRAVAGCRGCGVCDAGCPSDAVLSAAETYLPAAQRAGATIIADARVRRIVVADGRAQGVVARTSSGAKITVHAKVVILAAGAVHTPSLLADSALGDLTGRLGRNLSVYPTTFVTGVFPDDLQAWRGVQQSLVVTEWLASHGLLLHAFGLGPSSAGHVIPGSGRALSERLEDLGRSVTVQVSVADAGSGRVLRGRDGHPAVEYDLDEHDARRLLRGVGHAASLLFAAGAKSVLTGVRGADEVSSAEGVAAMEDEAVARRAVRITAGAPSGSAAIGVDAATSVCDPNGAVRGVRGLFVSDAAAMPTSAAVPPQATIMALATRMVDHLARHSGEYL